MKEGILTGLLVLMTEAGVPVTVRAQNSYKNEKNGGVKDGYIQNCSDSRRRRGT